MGASVLGEPSVHLEAEAGVKLRHNHTGDTLEVPPPNRTGQSVVRFNGRIVEKVTYSDDNGGSVTTEDGRMFTSQEWSDYLVEQLKVGAWRVIH